jgi:hypothetical protein
LASATSLAISRWGAILLGGIYVQYLVFQLHTHSYLFEEEPNGGGEDAELTKGGSIALLLVTTVLVSINSEALVGSIEGLTEEMHLSHNFVGVILLPIVGNAAEHLTAVSSAIKNKMNLALGVAVGSSTQISLCVVRPEPNNAGGIQASLSAATRHGRARWCAASAEQCYVWFGAGPVHGPGRVGDGCAYDPRLSRLCLRHGPPGLLAIRPTSSHSTKSAGLSGCASGVSSPGARQDHAGMTCRVVLS